MRKDSILQSFFSNYKFLFAKAIAELCMIVFLAGHLSPAAFGKGMVVITLAYLLLGLTKSESMDIGRALFCGLSAGIILFGFSVLYPGMAMLLRTAVFIAFIASVRKFIESKFKSSDEIKIYHAGFFGQMVGAIALIAGISTFKSSMIIPGVYVIVELASTIILWRGSDFQFGRLQPSMRISEFGKNLLSNLIENSLSILLLITALFSVEAYSYLFLSLYIGLFFYRNVTLIVVSKFKDYFREVKGDELRVDVIHILGYVSLMVVLSSIFIPLSNDFSSIIGWPGMTDTFILLLFAGIAKGIFEVYRLIVKPKIAEKIGLLELIMLTACLVIAVRLVGAHGFAIAILLSYIGSFFLYQRAVEKKFRQDISVTSRDYFYIVLSGGISAISVALIKELFPAKGALSFIFLAAFGAAVYYVLTFILNQNLYRRFIRFMFESLEKK